MVQLPEENNPSHSPGDNPIHLQAAGVCLDHRQAAQSEAVQESRWDALDAHLWAVESRLDAPDDRAKAKFQAATQSDEPGRQEQSNLAE